MAVRRKRKNSASASLILLLAAFVAAGVYVIYFLISGGKTDIDTPKDKGQTYNFTTVSKSYFDDALFIGDSRVSGIKAYGALDNSDFFCNISLSLYSVGSASLPVSDGKEMTLDQVLQNKTYGKVYICFGANSLTYPDFSETVNKLQSLIDRIKSTQPKAIIFINSCLHFTDEVSALKGGSNELINRYNQKAAEFADGNSVFYIDINKLFDVNGALNPDITGDGIHPNGNAYLKWSEWLRSYGIVKEDTKIKGISDSSSESVNSSDTRTIVVKPEDYIPYNGYLDVDDSYFSDALFIGDSRMVGLSRYAFDGCDSFCDVGMTLYSAWNKTINGKTLSGMLNAKKYSKIYLEFGANTLTYNFSITTSKFEDMINNIRISQPNAKIYIISCLHFSNKESTQRGDSNDLINRYNNMVKRYANNFDIFYIDVNEIFDDETGSLRSDLTGDGIHPNAKAYKDWGAWLKSKGVASSPKKSDISSSDNSSGTSSKS